MTINHKHQSEIEELSRLIEKGQEEEALASFDKYLSDIHSLEPPPVDVYLLRNWKKDVYYLGDQINVKGYSKRFISKIEDHLGSAGKAHKETLEFMRSTIVIGFIADSIFKERLCVLIKEYPQNPDFRYILGRVYYKEKDYLKAAELYKTATQLNIDFYEYTKRLSGNRK